jgi:hypothetical protein
LRPWRAAGEDFLRVKVGPMEYANVVSPAMRVNPGGLVFARMRVRLFEAFGVACLAQIYFLDEQGETLGKMFIGEEPAVSRITLDAWTEPLRKNQWPSFQVAARAPENAAYATLLLSIWKTSSSRRYLPAANEIHIMPPEAAIGPGARDGATESLKFLKR